MFSPFFLLRYGWDFWQNGCLSLFAIIWVCLNLLLLLWYAFFFTKGIKRIEKETIKIESFAPNDVKAFDFVLQTFPIIVSMANVIYGLAIYAFMVFYMTKSNLNFISPLLFFQRSNIYEITIAGGGGTSLLIAKKEIKNQDEITYAKNIFPYFYVGE